MVKEAKKSCYGKWNFPAGHLETGETLLESAIREVREETGCLVHLTGILPIIKVVAGKEELLLFHFVADFVTKNSMFDSKEILEVKWFSIEELEKLSVQELRDHDTNKRLIQYFKKKQIYPLDIIAADFNEIHKDEKIS